MNDTPSLMWAYISTLVLWYPEKPVEVGDNIETFIWLIVYIAMHLYKHNLSKTPAKLTNLTNKLFYKEEIGEHGCWVGGKT
ncbi:uncharacterized protein PHACADRAFT_211239 [Phanerochaete carnosa HHB-10118-sp]|uniref:Fungal-type protein kinase domain-containing protein n=1 Tax=Phanerochaete carnosa (strain HHB-10118-sp) TaxID=650164 RepID=K5UU88_PHACS|nr:uncharacterized protein PHACADRAFT_211239 [Phanerochaete carnosa HHB-10118-sp]EKM53561.1 hypothetical protein PHACADRAFT_211239 [Phanerochaete carnosa HHB-10118-sp]